MGKGCLCGCFADLVVPHLIRAEPRNGGLGEAYAGLGECCFAFLRTYYTPYPADATGEQGRAGQVRLGCLILRVELHCFPVFSILLPFTFLHILTGYDRWTS